MYTKTHSKQKKREKPKPPVVSADALASTQHALHIEVYTHKVFHTQKIIKRLKKK